MRVLDQIDWFTEWIEECEMILKLIIVFIDDTFTILHGFNFFLYFNTVKPRYNVFLIVKEKKTSKRMDRKLRIPGT